MINLRFLLNSALLVLLVAGGAYYIYSKDGNEMNGTVPTSQEMPVVDSKAGAVPEKTVSDAIPPANTVTVSISDFAFSPKELRIPVGTKVIWTNNDRPKHNVIADKGEFASRLLATGESFEFTFDSKGTFSYLCEPHPWMKATVIVE